MGFRILSPIFVPLPCGTRLCTVVCLPDEKGGPFPAIGIRSPYSICAEPEAVCALFAGQNVAIVLQDCRGTGASEGEPDFWTQEKEDGQAFLSWLAEQHWFNGRLVMTGESYSGSTQWQAARCHDSVLIGITPHNAPSDGCRTVCIPSGAIAPAVGVCWSIIMGRRRMGLPDPEVWTDILRHQPLLTADLAAGIPKQPFYRKMISRPFRDAFWNGMNVEPDIPRITVPAYITGGWFDPLLMDTLHTFTKMKNTAGSEKAREWTRLLIEPVDHESTTRHGDFGRSCRAGIIGLRKRFMLNLLRDPESDPLPDQPPVRLFILGSNRWLAAEEWPVPAKETPFFLHSGAALVPQKPRQNGSDFILCDQNNLVPSRGGCDLNLPGFSAGQALQNDIEARKDVLLYTSDVLAKDLTVIGYIRAVLYVSSDAPDADFTVKLCDVKPDGSSWNVCGGIARASFRNGDDRPAQPLQKNEIIRLDISCRATAITFLAGHRIRVQISWSDYPRFLPNPNTGDPEYSAETRRNAVQKVYFGEAMPSRIFLPVYADEM